MPANITLTRYAWGKKSHSEERLKGEQRVAHCFKSLFVGTLSKRKRVRDFFMPFL